QAPALSFIRNSEGPQYVREAIGSNIPTTPGGEGRGPPSPSHHRSQSQGCQEGTLHLAHRQPPNQEPDQAQQPQPAHTSQESQQTRQEGTAVHSSYPITNK
ncbi:hypothetical protein CRENBAI_025626, partial [Crenichthys baileyi]